MSLILIHSQSIPITTIACLKSKETLKGLYQNNSHNLVLYSK